MKISEQHVSPDGLLRLIVVLDDDGDTSIGFDGLSWHIHGDMLAAMSGLSEEDSIRAFVDEILDDQSTIAVSRIDGKLVDAWPTDDPLKELKYNPPEEDIEFRYWSGRTPTRKASDQPQ